MLESGFWNAKKLLKNYWQKIESCYFKFWSVLRRSWECIRTINPFEQSQLDVVNAGKLVRVAEIDAIAFSDWLRKQRKVVLCQSLNITTVFEPMPLNSFFCFFVLSNLWHALSVDLALPLILSVLSISHFPVPKSKLYVTELRRIGNIRE